MANVPMKIRTRVINPGLAHVNAYESKPHWKAMGTPRTSHTIINDELHISEDVYRGGSRITFEMHGVEGIIPSKAYISSSLELDAYEFLEYIKAKNVDLDKHQYIRLLMCHSAEGEKSFAQTLSNLTQKPVKGFLGEVR
jgi:hypothetical protein